MKNSHLYLDEIEKKSFVWHEDSWTFPQEYHTHNKGQLIFVEKGYQYLHLKDQIFLLPQNHVAWIPSMWSHKTAAPTSNVFLRTIYYDCEGLDGFFEDLQIFTLTPLLRSMILHTEKWSKNPNYNAAEYFFLQAILHELPECSKNSLRLNLPIPSHPKLIAVVQHLRDNWSASLDIENLARQFLSSSRTLERLFKRETGLSPAKYLQLLRCLKAIELLHNSELTISEISYQVGYKTVQSFSNSFHKLLGSRPTAFR